MTDTLETTSETPARPRPPARTRPPRRELTSRAATCCVLRQRTRELAGLDDDDPDAERDAKLLWWFRRQRDQAD
jgi:hypothetical protein